MPPSSTSLNILAPCTVVWRSAEVKHGEMPHWVGWVGLGMAARGASFRAQLLSTARAGQAQIIIMVEARWKKLKRI